jgi:hypothetical protein
MRPICLVSMLLLVLTVSYGQTKARLTFNYGYQFTSTYTKLFDAKVCDEGCYMASQQAAWFPDLNIMYDQDIRDTKWRIQAGVDVNSKGWYEEGMASDGSANLYPYQYTFSYSYTGLLAGASYFVAGGRSWRFVVGQLLNPEVNFYNNDSILRRLALSTRTTASIEWTPAQRIPVYVLVTPYFHTALFKYNKEKLYPASSNYLPYGIGLNIGVGFNVKGQG